MAELFGTTRNNITMHLKEIYDSKELDEKATSKDFLLVQKEGQRDVKRNTKYYSLEVIIAVGFKVNSQRAIDFRLWAINILKQNSVKGYVLDKERLKNGAFLDENYFDLPPIDDLEDTLTEINTTQTREEEKHIPIEPKEKGASSIVKREKTPEEIQGDLKDRFGIEVPLEKCKTYLQAYNTIGSLSTVNSLRVMWKEDIWKEIGEAKDFEVALAKGEKISNKTIKAFYFRYFLPGLDGKKPEQGVTYDLTNGKNHNPIFEVAAD